MRVRYVEWLAMTASVAAGVVGAIFPRSSDCTAPTLGCRASCVDEAHRSRHASVRSALAHPRRLPGSRIEVGGTPYGNWFLKTLH
jgi:hypothetical protein